MIRNISVINTTNFEWPGPFGEWGRNVGPAYLADWMPIATAPVFLSPTDKLSDITTSNSLLLQRPIGQGLVEGIGDNGGSSVNLGLIANASYRHHVASSGLCGDFYFGEPSTTRKLGYLLLQLGLGQKPMLQSSSPGNVYYTPHPMTDIGMCSGIGCDSQSGPTSTQFNTDTFELQL